MANWKDILTHLAVDAENRMDELRYRLHYQLGGMGPVKIIPYRGYGTTEHLFLRGRVLEDKGIPEAEKNDKIWENLLYMYQRLESDEVPHARLLARYGSVVQEVQADEEGFFEVNIQLEEPPLKDRLWHPVELELVDHIPQVQASYPVKAVGEVFVPQSQAKYVVVSDIDDTVLLSNATHMLRMVRSVFLGNAYTRLPFPGVAALYRALFAGASGSDMNPLFYVSSSPWNFYDLLSQFFNLHSIPVGPVLLLRDWGLTDEEILPLHHKEYKTKAIRRMLQFYPDLPFILIGDSGQEDPEIYTELVSEFPKRIKAVYIRNVSRDLKRPEDIRKLAEQVLKAGSALVLADDSLSIAKHAVEQGFISPQSLPLISEDKQKDEEPPTTLDKMLGEPVKREGPTVRVSPQAVKEGEVEEVVKETGDKKTEKPPTVVVEGEKAKQRSKNKNKNQ
jgi:phosphatidate phosphatase APP1